jgi:hypothetical protein
MIFNLKIAIILIRIIMLGLLLNLMYYHIPQQFLKFLKITKNTHATSFQFTVVMATIYFINCQYVYIQHIHLIYHLISGRIIQIAILPVSRFILNFKTSQ